MFDAWFDASKSTAAPVTRTPEAQARVDAQSAELALYHYDSCLYCARVRKAIAALGLNIELRNVMTDRAHYRELLANGGSTTVPCLRIGVRDAAADRWMYESADIVRYLIERFGAET